MVVTGIDDDHGARLRPGVRLLISVFYPVIEFFPLALPNMHDCSATGRAESVVVLVKGPGPSP